MDLAFAQSFLVDQHRDVRGARCTASFGQGEQCVGSEERLFLEWVVGAVVRCRISKERVACVPQAAFEQCTVDGVEAAVEAPHAVGVGPPSQPGVAPLSCQTGQAVVGTGVAEHGVEELSELAIRPRCRDPRQFGTAGREPQAFGFGEAGHRPGDLFQPVACGGASCQRGTQFGDVVGGLLAVAHPTGFALRRLRRACDFILREDRRPLGSQLVEPGAHLHFPRIQKTAQHTNVIQVGAARSEIGQRCPLDEFTQRLQVHAVSMNKGCDRDSPRAGVMCGNDCYCDCCYWAAAASASHTF